MIYPRRLRSYLTDLSFLCLLPVDFAAGFSLLGILCFLPIQSIRIQKRLGVVKNKSGPETEKIKKNIKKILKENKLDIVIKCNMKLVTYLDVTLKLNNSNYKPYHKPDNEIFITIKIQTTHSASLIKSPYQLRKEFPPDHLKKPYLTKQKKYTKKL